MIPINGIHLELTNKCHLKCPECSRTLFINKFGITKWKNNDLSLADIKQFLDVDLQGVKILLCGSQGDPIYHPELIEVVKWLKSKSAIVDITTNGSFKSAEWWQQLAEILTDKDQINFSIDGTPENFTKYRINADWKSIETGIVTLKKFSKVKLIWKFIPFDFNETDIDSAKQLSIQLGFDEFYIFYGYRWSKFNNNFSPKNLIFVDSRVEARKSWAPDNTNSVGVSPECKIDYNMHYISSDGFYSPCCYITDWRFYYKTDFYKNREMYDIKKTTLEKILSDKKIINFYNNIEEAKLPACTFNCPKI